MTGSYALVADGEFGIQVVDLSTPASPVIVANVETPGTAVDVVLLGDYAYVAESGYGIQVIDVSAPATPIAVGRVNAPAVETCIAALSGYIFVGTVDDGHLYVLPIQCDD